MKSVKVIRSAEGDYFVIGKTEGGYYLKNEYTEIPNEFNMYSMDTVEKMFEELCDRIPECDEVSVPSGHVNSCMWVYYEDGTKQLYKQTERGMNLCAFTSRTADYSEYNGFKMVAWSGMLMTLEHLREVCKKGIEDYDFFYRALKRYDDDDEMRVEEDFQDDGSVVFKGIYLPFGTHNGITVSLMPDGTIDETNNIKFVEVLKQNGVRVIKNSSSEE